MDESNVSQTMSDIEDVLASLFSREGLGARSRALAVGACRELGFYFGGRAFYLPRGDAYMRAKRNQEIVEKFQGNNYAELAAEYGMCAQNVYKIIASHKKLSKTPVNRRYSLFQHGAGGPIPPSNKE